MPMYARRRACDLLDVTGLIAVHLHRPPPPPSATPCTRPLRLFLRGLCASGQLELFLGGVPTDAEHRLTGSTFSPFPLYPPHHAALSFLLLAFSFLFSTLVLSGFPVGATVPVFWLFSSSAREGERERTGGKWAP